MGKRRKKSETVLGRLEAEGKLKTYWGREMAEAHKEPIREHLLACFSEGPTSATRIGQGLGVGVEHFWTHVESLEQICRLREVDPPAWEKRKRGPTPRYFEAIVATDLDAEGMLALPDPVATDMQAGALRGIANEASVALKVGTFRMFSNNHLSWTPIRTDKQGWDQTMAVLDTALRRIMEIHRETSARLLETGEPAISMTVGMLGFARPDGYSFGMSTPE